MPPSEQSIYGLCQFPQSAIETRTDPIISTSAHRWGSPFVEGRLDSRFAYLVQKTMAVDEQNEMPAEKKDENNCGKSRHDCPEADIVDQSAETEKIGNRNEKVTYFVYHWDFPEMERVTMDMPCTGFSCDPLHRS